jgi:hypothetical protein
LNLDFVRANLRAELRFEQELSPLDAGANFRAIAAFGNQINGAKVQRFAVDRDRATNGHSAIATTTPGECGKGATQSGTA